MLLQLLQEQGRKMRHWSANTCCTAPVCRSDAAGVARKSMAAAPAGVGMRDEAMARCILRKMGLQPWQGLCGCMRLQLLQGLCTHMRLHTIQGQHAHGVCHAARSMRTMASAFAAASCAVLLKTV